MNTQTATVGVTVGTDNRGDLVAHVAGCKDLTNSRHMRQSRNEPGNTFEAATMAEAIRLMDADWADAFGEPYPVTAEHRGEVWSIGWGSIQSAPCLVAATKGMTWTENREPVVAKVAPVKRAPLMVRTIVMVAVDRDAYEAEYGEAASDATIRGHIKGSVVTAAESAFEHIDAIKVTDWS